MSLQTILVLVSIAAIYGFWYWFATREERNKRRQEENLNVQRRVLGIKPGAGAVNRRQSLLSDFSKTQLPSVFHNQYWPDSYFFVRALL